MKFKKPSDFPRKPLDLFSEYRHGHIDRRSFLDAAGRLAGGGLAVGAVFETIRPSSAWAQRRRRRHTRVPPALSIGSRPASRFRFRSMWGPWIWA